MHRDACALADELVVGAFIDVLKSAPAADVVNQNATEIARTALHIRNKRLQSVTPANAEPAKPLVGIDADDCQVPALSIGRDHLGLVSRRVLLMIRSEEHTSELQ